MAENESRKRWIIGAIIIPVIGAVVGLTPYFHEKFFTEDKDTPIVSNNLNAEKKKQAITSYKEGLQLFNKGKHEEARILFKAAINQGRILDAYYPLARCYKERLDPDYEKYKFYCEEGIENGDMKCHYGLWDYYFLIKKSDDEFLIKNHAKNALEAMQKIAESGNAFWQGKLGALYKIQMKDYDNAAYWHKKAADQGDAFGQYSLGQLHHEGKGVELDSDKAFYWYKKAADQGFPFAQNILGFSYYYGEGKDIDYKQALYWYKKAAEQGHANAQHGLGQIYYFGKGLESDFQKAFYWNKKAAEQGNSNSQYDTGNAYYYGEGIEIDYEQAFNWYKKSADQGNALGQNGLGMVYTKGKGANKDLEKAEYWFQKAADQGLDTAIKNLNVIKKHKKIK